MSFYGYKNHIKTDKGTKLITDYMVTDAPPRHCRGSQELEPLLDKADAGQSLYADAAYIGQEKSIEECGMTNEVHEKGNRYHKLTETQKASSLKPGEITPSCQGRACLRLYDQHHESYDYQNQRLCESNS
jgi:transposase, IS5 family